ncbi:MAG: hypothetical protein ACPLRH_08005, partial [Desulfotomaculales bacterium]
DSGVKSGGQRGSVSAEFFFLEMFSVMAAAFVAQLFALALSRAAFQGDPLSYLLQAFSSLTARDALSAAGKAFLIPFALLVLLFAGVLAYGAGCLLWRSFRGVDPHEEDGYGFSSLPASPEETEAFLRSAEPEKRRLAVRSPACPLELVREALDDGDKRVRLNALCRLVAAGAITEKEARETFASWAEEYRRYAEKNFGLLLEIYSCERNFFDGSGTLCGV